MSKFNKSWQRMASEVDKKRAVNLSQHRGPEKEEECVTQLCPGEVVRDPDLCGGVHRNTQVLHQIGMNKDYSNIILDVKDLFDVTVAPSVGQCEYV